MVSQQQSEDCPLFEFAIIVCRLCHLLHYICYEETLVLVVVGISLHYFVKKYSTDLYF